MNAFDALLEQIDSFIRKYYKSEILKGFIFIIGFLLTSWLLVSTLEYFGRFSSVIRFFFLLFFVVSNSYFVVKFFIIPILKLFSFGNQINRYQAAKIIGTFFPSISDRLLNTLQLSNESSSSVNYELIRASVYQRSNDLLSVKFADAVKYDKSKRYIKFVLPVVILFISLFYVSPSLILKGSSNVVNFTKAQEAPFNFLLLSHFSDIQEGSNYTIKVKITGMYIPENVTVFSSRGTFQLKRIKKNVFELPFDNLTSNFSFYLKSDGYSSKEFNVKVLGKSSLGKLQAHLIFPKYLHRKNEFVSNVADISVPEGTRIDWFLHAKNVSSIRVQSLQFFKSYNSQQINFSTILTKDDKFHFFLKNSFLPIIDTSIVSVSIIKDAYPLISVTEFVDSIKSSIRYFEGSISDDYGLTSLNFHYIISRENGKQIKRSFPVSKVSGLSQKFDFAVDFSRDSIQLNDKISYFFSVNDNDKINGSKQSLSQSFIYQLPSLIDLNSRRDETNESLKSSLKQVLDKTDKFKKDISKFQKELSQKNGNDFKTLDQLQSLKNQQLQLQQELLTIKEKFAASNEEKSKLTEQDQSILEQQELIDKLLNEVMDDELKKLLEELTNLLEKQQTNQAKQESEKLNNSSEKLKSQMDRTLEMLKRMQVDEKIDALEKELQELSKLQEELSQQAKDKNADSKELLIKQEDLSNKFDTLKKNLEELDKLNNDLERPMNLDTNKELQNSISDQLKKAKDNLNKDSKSKASSNQKGAADDMKKLSDQLNQQQEASKSKQNQEDMKSIRVLLENLISLSLDQERIMKSFGILKEYDQRYTRLGKLQRRIIDDSKSVEDSLLSIAKRQPKISSFIDKELADIKSNFSLISNEYRERQLRPLLVHQQYVMTSYNNLALMLNESLQQMQGEGNPKMSGSGSCSNPNGSGKKPSDGEMSGESMKEILKNQLDKLKKGANPGGKSPGDKPGDNGMPLPGISNMELAKMAAQQSALRQQLERMRDQLNKDGSGTGNKLNPLLNDLDKQVNDLINKNFSSDLVRRQQDILTRLLEAESAMRTRGFEEKRESVSGKNSNYSNLIQFKEYNRLNKLQVDLVRSVEPDLSLYYKTMASKYFNKK